MNPNANHHAVPADTTGRHYTVFGPVPLNYTPTASYKLSRANIKNADKVFDRYDRNGSGYVTVNELSPLINDVFASENMPPPSPSDVAFVLDKHHYAADHKIKKREFKRLLKEVAGSKKYDRGNLGAVKPKRHPDTHVFQNAFEGTQVTRAGVTGVLNEQSGYPGFYTPQVGVPVAPHPVVAQGNATPFGPVPHGYHNRVYGVTPHNIKRSHELFRRHDLDNSGYISMYELPNLLAEVFAMDGLQPPYPTDVAYLLQKYDFNHDRRLSYWEFKRLLKELSGTKKFDRSTITVYKYQRTTPYPMQPGQPGYVAAPMPMHQSHVVSNSGTSSMYNTIPANHVPRTFILSRGAIRASKYIFRKYDVQHTGHVSASQLDNVVREVFVHDGQQAPTSSDIAYLLHQYDYQNRGQFTEKEVKRILKSLTSAKSYNKGTFGMFGKSKNSANRV